MISSLRTSVIGLVTMIVVAAAAPRAGWAQVEGSRTSVDQVSSDSLQTLLLAAEQGNAGAQFSLGYMYDTGEGVPENDVEAVRWYRAAAEQGNAGAQFNLGLMYATGEGVPENDVEAVRWFRAAAEQGDAGGQFSLGYMYDTGEGVPENYVSAYAWLNLAAAQGVEGAREAKEDLSQRMTNEQVALAQKLSIVLLDKINPDG